MRACSATIVRSYRAQILCWGSEAVINLRAVRRICASDYASYLYSSVVCVITASTICRGTLSSKSALEAYFAK
jgi:hypothetical protein